MKTQAVHCNVQVPSVDDFLMSHRQYAAVRDTERELFELVVTPENFLAARAVTERLEMPAVSAVADMVTQYCRRGGAIEYIQVQASAHRCPHVRAHGSQWLRQDREEAIDWTIGLVAG